MDRLTYPRKFLLISVLFGIPLALATYFLFGEINDSLGVGIAQGYATIGAIGFEGRWDYGAIGTVTNLAARLCGEAKPGQIFVSRRFLGTVEDLVETEPEGNVTLKGFVRPVPVFNVVGLKTDQGGTHAWTPTCSSSIRPPRPAPGPKRGARCRSTARYWSQRLRCWRRAG